MEPFAAFCRGGGGFGLGIFCGAEPPVGCRESDLTPVPDESFVSPASASSVETSPEPEPMPEKWVCLTFDDGPSKTTPDVCPRWTVPE